MSDSDIAPHFDTAERAQAYVQTRLPDFSPAGAPTRLPEGNLNVVWRVPGGERSVIVKYAPPHIAVDPETPLDPSRLTIEARCLEALSPEGDLAPGGSCSIRPPRLIDYQENPHVLIMKDCGEGPTLGRWFRASPPAEVQSNAPSVGRQLGRFIGQLHQRTVGDSDCAVSFNNKPMQETRRAVQYQNVTTMLRAGGVEDATTLGKRAAALGEALLEPGRCVTMGDLWPSSVLVRAEGLRIIDWELAHYGRPLQDVAHLAAHLWMQRHRAPSAAVGDAIEALQEAFLDAYRTALGAASDELWDAAERRDAPVHFGAEILVRAVGPFQTGYLYDGLAPEHPAVQEAVTTAAHALRSPEAMELLSGTGRR